MYLDGWGRIEEGSVELKPVSYIVFRQLAPEYSVIDVEADEKDA
jgi:hypothetical protein